MSLKIKQIDGDVRLDVKAVPGASRDEIAGLIGERLKVRISAPAEGGKANKAICTLIADALGVKSKQVSIESGGTSREKTVRIAEVTVGDTRTSLIEYVDSRRSRWA